MKTIIVIVALFCLASASKLRATSTVAKIDHHNFKSIHSDNEYLLVEFFSPKCPHCTEFAPDFKIIAEDIAKNHPNVQVGTVDVSVEDSLTDKFDVMSVPKLLFFRKGSNTPVIYPNHREVDQVLTWVDQEINLPLSAQIMAQTSMNSIESLDPVCYLN